MGTCCGPELSSEPKKPETEFEKMKLIKISSLMLASTLTSTAFAQVNLNDWLKPNHCQASVKLTQHVFDFFSRPVVFRSFPVGNPGENQEIAFEEGVWQLNYQTKVPEDRKDALEVELHCTPTVQQERDRPRSLSFVFEFDRNVIVAAQIGMVSEVPVPLQVECFRIEAVVERIESDGDWLVGSILAEHTDGDIAGGEVRRANIAGDGKMAWLAGAEAEMAGLAFEPVVLDFLLGAPFAPGTLEGQ